MKKIAYLIVDNGCDGREPDSLVAAFWEEGERDKAFDGNKNNAYYRKTEQIVDLDKAKEQAMKKLNAVDRLILRLPLRDIQATPVVAPKPEIEDPREQHNFQEHIGEPGWQQGYQNTDSMK